MRPPLNNGHHGHHTSSSAQFAPADLKHYRQQQHHNNQAHQHRPIELPEHLLRALHATFRQFDAKGTGLVPYEYICRHWPLKANHSSPSPPAIPSLPNFLDHLRRVRPPDGLITFQRFLHAAELAIWEKFSLSNGHALKRVRSEGKLPAPAEGGGRAGTMMMPPAYNGGGGQRAEEQQQHQRHHQQERPKSQCRTSTPAMGISGRKLDPREYGRLLKMKKASRSQPQLNELFANNGKKENGGGGNVNGGGTAAGLRRTEQFANGDAFFNMKFVENKSQVDANGNGPPVIVCPRSKKPKSLKAPPPPTEPPVILDNNNFSPSGNGGGNYARVKGAKGQRGEDAEEEANGRRNNFMEADEEKLQKSPAPVNYCLLKKADNQQRQSQQKQRQQRPISVASSIPTQMMHRSASAATYQVPANQQQMQQIQQQPMANGNGLTAYGEELQPQVAKHEHLLEEEFHVVHMGQLKAQELLDWYSGRMESLEKRRRMLQRGLVALDSAVHEQKLNFHRAQIAELNRRIKTFLCSTDSGGFPGAHQQSQQQQQMSSPKQQPIRSQVLPPPFQQLTAPAAVAPCSSTATTNSACSAASSSSNASSASSGSMPIDGTFSSASEAEFLRAQNQKLMRDVRQLSQQIEHFQMAEERQQQKLLWHHGQQMMAKSAIVSPNVNGNGNGFPPPAFYPPHHQPSSGTTGAAAKDTLL